MATALSTATTSSKGKATPRGVALTMLGGLFYSTAPVFARPIVGLDAAAITFFRSLVPITFFAAIILSSPAKRRAANWRRWHKSEKLAVAGLGVLLAVTSWLYTYSYLHTTVARAVLLGSLAPVYLGVLGPWLLHEARPRFAAIVFPLGIAGIVMITDPVGLFRVQTGELLGVLAGWLCGISYTFEFVLGRFLANRIDPAVRVFYASIFMGLVLLPCGLTTTSAQLLPNIPNLLGLGFVAFAVPLFFAFWGQKYITSQVSSFAALFEPVCGIAIGYVLYMEILTPLGIVGAAAILASIFLASRE